MLIFAEARDGITVFDPAPMNPPGIPWTSNVGRAQLRSNTLNPGSPVSAVEPTSSRRNSASSNGSFAHASVSAFGGGTTRS